MMVPRMQENAATHPPTQRDTLAPYITRINRSRPNSSVPKRCPFPGGCRRSATTMAFGSVLFKIGTRTANNRIITNPTHPMINPGLARRRSLRSWRCSFRIAILASEALFLVKYISPPPTFVPAEAWGQRSHTIYPQPD